MCRTAVFRKQQGAGGTCTITQHPYLLPETGCYPGTSVPTVVHAINSRAFSSGAVPRLWGHWAIGALVVSKATPKFRGGGEVVCGQDEEKH